MRAVIGSNNIKFYSRSLVFLAKFGDEFRFRSTDDTLVIECLQQPLNIAFIQLKFDKRFFVSWEPDEAIDLKMRAKSCVAVYHNPRLLEKSVLSSEMMFENERSNAFFRHIMRHDVRKEYNIPLISQPQLTDINFPDYQADYKVHLLSTIKLIFDGLKIFGKNDLVTMRIQSDQIRMETGDEDTANVISSFYFDRGEFSAYNVKERTDITYSIKFVKQFLNLFQQKKQPNLHSFIEDSTSPVVFACDFPYCEARLLVAPVDREYPDLPTRPNRTSDTFSHPDDGNLDEFFEDDLDDEIATMVAPTQDGSFEELPSSLTPRMPRDSSSSGDEDDDSQVSVAGLQLMMQRQYLGYDAPSQLNEGDNEVLVPNSDDEDDA
ncbi:hypothetical protein HDE_07166 [Halotydeus destructor]|nr:hypothetical protein HDE_07166 [Halotydeus destructor]